MQLFGLRLYLLLFLLVLLLLLLLLHLLLFLLVLLPLLLLLHLLLLLLVLLHRLLLLLWGFYVDNCGEIVFDGRYPDVIRWAGRDVDVAIVMLYCDIYIAPLTNTGYLRSARYGL